MSKCKNHNKGLLTFALGINRSFACKVCWQYVGTNCQIMLKILILLLLSLTFLTIFIYITLLELPEYGSQVRNKINNPMPMENMTVINITNFQFLINNNICNVSNIHIVTLIYSSAQNAEARDNIRYSTSTFLVWNKFEWKTILSIVLTCIFYLSIFRYKPLTRHRNACKVGNHNTILHIVMTAEM